MQGSCPQVIARVHDDQLECRQGVRLITGIRGSEGFAMDFRSAEKVSE